MVPLLCTPRAEGWPKRLVLIWMRGYKRSLDVQVRMSTHVFVGLFDTRDKAECGKRRGLTEDWGRTDRI